MMLSKKLVDSEKIEEKRKIDEKSYKKTNENERKKKPTITYRHEHKTKRNGMKRMNGMKPFEIVKQNICL